MDKRWEKVTGNFKKSNSCWRKLYFSQLPTTHSTDQTLAQYWHDGSKTLNFVHPSDVFCIISLSGLGETNNDS